MRALKLYGIRVALQDVFRCRSRLKKHPCKGKPLDPICLADSL